MANRASIWSVTINNPIPADAENIELARQKGWKIEGQLERGESGTPHYQLLVRTGQVRFSALKRAFPRSHIEVCRNPEALKNYVNKAETRLGQLPNSPESYPSQLQVFDDFGQWIGEETRGAYNDLDGDGLLRMWDKFVSQRIEEGQIIENMAVNPQTRSAVKLYGFAIIARSNLRRRQTDRQTEETLIPEINIPTLNEVSTQDTEQDGNDEQECESESGSALVNGESEEGGGTNYEGESGD